MIEILLLIPLIGCLMAAHGNKRLELYRISLFEAWSNGLINVDPKLVMRAVNVVLVVAIVMFIFLWPILLLLRFLKS